MKYLLLPVYLLAAFLFLPVAVEAGRRDGVVR